MQGSISSADLVFILVCVVFLLISIVSLILINKKEKKVNTMTKAQRDMIDLEKIAKNLEENYHPINIELTNYEKEQEDSAIISYEELIKNKDFSYKEIPTDTDGVKKIELNENTQQIPTPKKVEVTLMSYEKEEAFLKALKQLQNDLVGE